MYCNYCGYKIDNDSKFCVSCGNKIYDNGFDFNYTTGEYHYLKKCPYYDIAGLKRCLQILKDCKELINTTKSPKVFFERYLRAIDILNELILVEKRYKNLFVGNKPSDIKNQLQSKEIYTVNDFLDRYYNQTIATINSLKTENAKQKRKVSFYNEIIKYQNYINKTSFYKFKTLYETIK